MTNPFHKGQRWISDSEPELGLGSVDHVSRLTVSLVFGASGEKREYAKDNAPLRRVRFHQGDTVKDREGLPLAITAVEERRGLIYYRGHDRELCETALLDAISFNKPEERLFVGQVDPKETFALRVSARDHQQRRRQSPVRGFLGGRIDLIPHQLYIAAETSGRLLPRVLLADEVGLGKTIEACLILHRLILTGRAQRVLILVPDSLVHQWLVEMLRRFNVWFHIFDEARCAAIEAARPDANPFLEDQFILASQRLFTDNERRVAQACEAGWDVMVVDEAHHLGWTPQTQSPEYRAVEALARAAPGLLLLTATPDSKFKVHFDGYEDTWDEVVTKSRIKGFRKGDEPRPDPPAKVRAKALQAAKTNTYRVGDQVRVDWNGKLYPAQIIDVVGKEQYRVHFDGYGPEFDENVGLPRIQPRL